MKAIPLLLATVLALAAAPAAAQERDANDTSLIILTLGGGARLGPVFPGAKDTKLRPWPLVEVRKVGTDPVFSTPDQSLGFSLLKGKGFRAGPAARLGESRDEEDAIEGIGDVGRAVELGAFAEYYLSPNLRTRAELRKGIGGHEGLIADLGADMILGKVTQPFHASIGPRLRFADGNYVRAFYGVDAEQSAATGLAPHDPEGGLHSAGALASAVYRTKGGLGLEGFARYDRLLGDSAASPLVRSSVGSRDRFEIGLGLTYSFGL